MQGVYSEPGLSLGVCVQLAQILLVLRKEGDPLPLRFQDYTLLALIAAAAQLCGLAGGGEEGVAALAARYHQDCDTVLQVRTPSRLPPDSMPVPALPFVWLEPCILQVLLRCLAGLATDCIARHRCQLLQDIQCWPSMKGCAEAASNAGARCGAVQAGLVPHAAQSPAGHAGQRLSCRHCY